MCVCVFIYPYPITSGRLTHLDVSNNFRLCTINSIFKKKEKETSCDTADLTWLY